MTTLSEGWSDALQSRRAFFADAYGRLQASPEGQRLTLDESDLWIAATAVTDGRLLITRDRIFAQIPGLQVEDWSV